jgi:hypothetical protein
MIDALVEVFILKSSLWFAVRACCPCLLSVLAVHARRPCSPSVLAVHTRTDNGEPAFRRRHYGHAGVEFSTMTKGHEKRNFTATGDPNRTPLSH